MSTERILIHGTTAQRMATTPALGQIGSDDETGRIVLGDGATPGGIEMARLDEVGGGTAGEIDYDNSGSGLGAENVQDAIDELAGEKASNSDVEKCVRVDEAQNFSDAEKGQGLANLGAGSLSGDRDRLINGDGRISQATYTTVNDDTYWCDMHYVLTQAAAITPTILTDVANGLPFMMRLSQSQATAQRMGNAQIVEAQVSKRLRGEQVTLGGKLRCSSSQAIRYAVLEWTGTADVVTSDVVANWTSGSFTAGNFFLGSNLTVAAVGTITPAANTLTDWSLTANISGSCNNLIVFLWTEGTAAQNVTLDMVWGLVQGDATAEKWPYGERDFSQELVCCQRFFEVLEIRVLGTVVAAADNSGATWLFKVRKRATPSMFWAGASSTQLRQATVDGARVTNNASAVAVILEGSSADARL
ncbi:hypothetical protein [Shinella fusca]|uniref:Major tropism determinant N-terminal domain-containing protein n=1 Tax=Shinella fusca TaxID=544480 RepID=A0A7W7YT65_9HYPH|nr:hypothetical protein [Shinella fusca]MBB5041920.1 hypothetical protein [Shinella fusca]